MIPVDHDGMRVATVHPMICGRDFEVVNPGDPLLATSLATISSGKANRISIRTSSMRVRTAKPISLWHLLRKGCERGVIETELSLNVRP